MGSSTRVRLTKMHGAQNDFVLLDARTAVLSDLGAFARWACDRRAGIGADGLLVLEPSRDGDVRMRTINADGSEAEMCGNGVRCAARWLDEAGAGERLAFDTAAGTIHTEIVARAPEYQVRVEMGIPRIASFAVPGFPEASFVDLGNPHVVVFCPDPEAVGLEALAERLQRDPRLPEGANVHVVAVGRLRRIARSSLGARRRPDDGLRHRRRGLRVGCHRAKERRLTGKRRRSGRPADASNGTAAAMRF